MHCIVVFAAWKATLLWIIVPIMSEGGRPPLDASKRTTSAGMTGFAKFKTAVMELGRDMGGDPRRGRPRQHFGRGRPPPGPRRSEDQDEMEEVARMLRSFALEGGPKHTDLVVAQMDGQFIGGPEAAMFTFEWYRTTADGTFSRIPGTDTLHCARRPARARTHGGRSQAWRAPFTSCQQMTLARACAQSACGCGMKASAGLLRLAP